MAEEQKQMSLDAVLDDKVEKPIEQTEKPLAGAEAYQSRKKEHQEKEFGAQGLERDPATGQYAKKGAKEEIKEPVKEEVKAEVKAEVKPSVEEYSAREKAAFAKAADETRKRQALERQLAEVNQKLKEPQKPFYEDPDGTLERRSKEHDAKLEHAVLTMKVQTSESIARSRYPDYEEKFSIFNELVQRSPYLAEQAFSSSDPGEFAYQTGKTEKNLRDAGGVDKLKVKMEEELRAKVKAEIEAEYKKREEDLKREREALPGSLTDVQSKGSHRQVWSGPTSLDNILKS